MMMALFEANPDAFRGNINRLRDGAVLNVPDPGTLIMQPETATAEVIKQTEAWRSGDRQIIAAKVPLEGQYGPVASGETLSGIAVRVVHSGVSMDQMMIALFQANPQAFNGNINMMHEGAVLRIPTMDELRRHSHEVATAEVMRQTSNWRLGHRRRAKTPAAQERIAALNRAPQRSRL